LQGERIELPSLPEPTSDFFLRATSITGERHELVLEPIYSRMEEELIKGEVRFNAFTKKIQYYDPGIDLLFELEQTSSMVSELAIIIAFLKFVVRLPEGGMNELATHHLAKNHTDSRLFDDSPLLFIEEPEAHLHPEIQVKLMTYLAELSKLGVKVVITTHSNYMFNKASNLILKGELEEERVANYHMIMTEKGSEVNEKVTLHDWGMEDENFGNVAEELLNERLQAAEDFNANVTH
jgi:AAA domain, putative AbiEii toxin, Type IV TA system